MGHAQHVALRADCATQPFDYCYEEYRMFLKLRSWAKAIKRDALTLWYACRHAETPLLAKLVAASVVAYAFSPIDLIPDFIPVLGLLDDAIIVPLGILLAMRLIPEAVVAECRQAAISFLASGKTKPSSRIGLAVVMAVWLAGAILTIQVLRQI